MGKVDFIEIDTLGNYLGKGGEIKINEYDIELGYDKLPVKLTRNNGEQEDIHCSDKLTDLIKQVRSVIDYLPYFIVIETPLKRKSISINRVSEDELDLSDYKITLCSLRPV
jgi:hypothetical protein